MSNKQRVVRLFGALLAFYAGYAVLYFVSAPKLPAWYPAAAGAGFVVLLLFSIRQIILAGKEKPTAAGLFSLWIEKYRFLVKQLVSRDFKTKYKRSVLGILWSFLNPMLTMVIQYTVFKQIFRFNTENYAVYLLTGIVFFNAFNDTTTQASNAIVGNASLITKVYVPKYIYPISKVLSTGITMLFSLIPLMLVICYTVLTNKDPSLILTLPTVSLLFLPAGLLLFELFLMGVSFLLSALMVFFRDIQFLWGVITLAWMYATPVIFPIDILEGTILYPLQSVNPMYHFITLFRTIFMQATVPSLKQWAACALCALIAFVIGGLVFRKTQKSFVLYI